VGLSPAAPSLPQRKVCDFVALYQNGQERIRDDARSGRRQHFRRGGAELRRGVFGVSGIICGAGLRKTIGANRERGNQECRAKQKNRCELHMISPKGEWRGFHSCARLRGARNRFFTNQHTFASDSFLWCVTRFEERSFAAFRMTMLSENRRAQPGVPCCGGQGCATMRWARRRARAWRLHRSADYLHPSAQGLAGGF
jgi:hypothetical protein